MDIVEKLDTLAEFYSQKDALELRKRELLDEVKIPDEIQQIVKLGMEKGRGIDAAMKARVDVYNKTIDAEIEAVKIPDELRAALAEIEKQRTELMDKFSEFEEIRNQIEQQKRDNYAYEVEQVRAIHDQLNAEIEAKTAAVYENVRQRKQEIEIEFSGKADDAEQNIKKLEAEIKADVKAAGTSVKGKYFHAVYVKGRVTWNTDKMDAWLVDHPFLREARKEGEPSITLRKI